MPELVYTDPAAAAAVAFRARDASPDSVIYTLESNFSLFSSASVSVERCSFTSDAHDRDSLASSEISLHLAGREESDEHESSSGPDRNPDPNKPVTVHKASRRGHGKTRARAEESNAQREDSRGATSTTATSVEDDLHHSDSYSARNSFSVALKECQDRRSRSESAVKKSDRRRPASLDLNNAVSSTSPGMGSNSVKNNSNSTTRRSSAFPSPGTPNHRIGMQKGWSSERVPSHANGGNRRHGGDNGGNSAASVLPIHKGRTLPFKWEDAERWILSPVAGDSIVRSSIPAPQKRPKSKSGPLGPPGNSYYSPYSPAVHVFDGGIAGNFIAGSPFSAGVLAADGLHNNIRSNCNRLPFPVRTEPCMARSVSVHGCSEVVAQYSQDGKIDELKDAATDISRAVSRRDMATQMSPEGSNHSSPSRMGSFTLSNNSALPSMEIQSLHSTKSEVRDVQVDERVTMTRWTKKHKSRNSGKSSEIVDDWRKRSIGARSSAWDVSEATKSISRAKREEARITAWESLQKAKAEAAIRKLEMKLEKKRSSSMDKIMKKLRSAQKRAQDMRSSVLANNAPQTSTSSHRVLSFRRTRQMTSLSGCFACHAC